MDNNQLDVRNLLQVKDIPNQAMNAFRGSRGMALLILTLVLE